jgi:hypothetical protein
VINTSADPYSLDCAEKLVCRSVPDNRYIDLPPSKPAREQHSKHVTFGSAKMFINQPDCTGCTSTAAVHLSGKSSANAIKAAMLYPLDRNIFYSNLAAIFVRIGAMRQKDGYEQTQGCIFDRIYR